MNTPHFKGDDIQTVSLGDFLITAQPRKPKLNFLSLVCKFSHSISKLLKVAQETNALQGLRAPGKLTVHSGDSDEPKTLKQGCTLCAL